MKNNDFDFIKKKFDACEKDVPEHLETERIEYKILTGRKHKSIEFKQKKNYKPILSAAACFILILGVLFAAVASNINFDKAATFSDFEELNAIVAPLEKITSLGSNGGPQKTHKYVQIDGVENAELIRTDGEYIYRAVWNDVNNNSVYIYQANGDNSEPVAVINDLSPDEIKEGDWYDVNCIFVYHNRLVVNISKRNYTLSEQYNRDFNTVISKIYDITEKSKPLLISEFEQSGEFVTAKMIGSILYISTNYNISEDNILPWIKNGSQTVYASPEDIAYFENTEVAQYAVLSSIDVEADKSAETLKAVLGGNADINCTKEYIYISKYLQYTQEGELTKKADERIIRLDLKKYKFSYAEKDEIIQFSDDIEINRYEAFTGVVYEIGDRYLCIGEDLNSLDNEIILYDKNMTEIDVLKPESLNLLTKKLFLNEDTGVFVLPVYSANDERRFYGIAVFRIIGNEIEMTNSIFNDELLINGNNDFVIIGDYFYCVNEDGKLYAFKYQ